MEYVDLGLSVKWATTNLGTKYLMNPLLQVDSMMALLKNKESEQYNN
ncbi:hypothetical protein [uncultured Prevotella sp.]|nr:hypothetical protein [uncultured Prevotella sp.]